MGVIKGNLSENNLVEKSRPLMLLSQIDLTGSNDGKNGDGKVSFSLGEFRVLDTYLSKINARDPEHRWVRFSKKEYEQLMGAKQLRPEQIDKLTNNLFDTKIQFQVKNANGEVVSYDKIHLFDKCRISRDSDEQWWIDMKCSEDARQLFFSVNEIGYFRYYLSNIINLVSLYSYRLYMYLLINGFRGEWVEGIDELRTILDCTAERYKTVKFFNAEVVKKAVAEVNEKTDIHVECVPEKTGRKISGFKFTIIKELQLEDEMPDEVDIDNEDPIEFLASALPPELTREQVEVLRDLALTHMPYEGIHGLADRELWLYHFLKKKMLLMKANGAKNPFAWLKKAVAEDWT